MLSRKQLWRKQMLAIHRAECKSDMSTSKLDSSSYDSSDSSSSCDNSSVSTSSQSEDSNHSDQICPSLNVSMDECIPIQSKKKVQFCNKVKVVLIPTCDEYYIANITRDLWWNKSDFMFFKIDACREVQMVLSRDAELTPKMAISLLYQPNSSDNIHEKENHYKNFEMKRPLGDTVKAMHHNFHAFLNEFRDPFVE